MCFWTEAKVVVGPMSAVDKVKAGSWPRRHGQASIAAAKDVPGRDGGVYPLWVETAYFGRHILTWQRSAVAQVGTKTTWGWQRTKCVLRRGGGGGGGGSLP